MIDQFHIMPSSNQDCLRMRALELLQNGSSEEAETILLKLLKTTDPICEDFIHLGSIYGIRSDWEKLESYSRKALEINPESLDAQNNLAIALKNKHNYVEAIKIYQEIISRDSKKSEAYFNLANALRMVREYDSALKVLKKSLKIEPNRAETYNEMALIYNEKSDKASAIIYLKKAIDRDPNWIDPYINYGNHLAETGRSNDALEQYQKALEIDGTNGLCLYNIASTMQSIGALKEALSFYEFALKSNFKSAGLFYNLGLLLLDLKNVSEAAEILKEAHFLEPENNIILSEYVMCKKKLASWDELPSFERFGGKYLSDNTEAFDPFFYIGHCEKSEMQYKNSTLFAKRFSSFCSELNHQSSQLDNKEKHHEKRKLKVGYFSSNFRTHPVLHLLKGVLRNHDTSKFDIYIFDTISTRPINDPYLEAIENSTLNYIHIGKNSLDESLVTIRDYSLDVAIDLMGYTDDKYICKLFSERVATVQINYLGYPGTTGSRKLHDYIIADKIVVPQHYEKYYAEKVVRLPGCYLCSDNTNIVADLKNFDGEEDSPIEKADFVFCSFNNIWKITPKEFNVWMRLLKKNPGSILWLRSDLETAIQNLKLEAKARNINPDRLIFAEKTDMAEHLARHQKADLFLDTFAYNAHATALDALWAGLPVLTMQGNNFPSRVGSSILSAAELPELITTSEHEYESKAQWLVDHPDELRQLKDRLIKNRLKCSLFNTEKTTRDLEQIYRECWQETTGMISK